MNCTQVAQAMNVSRPAARRILLTLQSLDYVRMEHGYFALSSKVLALGRGLLAKGRVWDIVSPEIVALANRLNEPASISTLE